MEHRKAAVNGAGAAAPAAALYECVVVHSRNGPLRHDVRGRTHLWCVDLDRLPVLPPPLRPLARFDARDHFTGRAATIRAGLEEFLAARDIGIEGGRVVMLAHARVLGFPLNPLSVYWCHDASGSLVCVVAEVHRTYRQRHCFLLHPDAGGRERAEKRFCVSPFFPVEGHYRMRLPLCGERLDLTVHLDTAAGRPFTATVRGRARPATAGTLLRAAARRPWSTAAVRAGAAGAAYDSWVPLPPRR